MLARAIKEEKEKVEEQEEEEKKKEEKEEWGIFQAQVRARTKAPRQNNKGV